jgi:hypothetical protein
MKIILSFLFLLPQLALSQPKRKNNISPAVKERTIPGSEIPVEEMNSAPTEIPADRDYSKDFPDVLEAKKRQEQQQGPKKKKQGP